MTSSVCFGVDDVISLIFVNRIVILMTSRNLTTTQEDRTSVGTVGKEINNFQEKGFRSQFQELFTSVFCAKKIWSQNVTKEKLCKTLLNKKFLSKMLIKLTAGLNLTNFLQAPFSH